MSFPAGIRIMAGTDFFSSLRSLDLLLGPFSPLSALGTLAHRDKAAGGAWIWPFTST